MMHRLSFLKFALPWILVLVSTDLFFVFLVWLAAPESLGIIALALIIFSALMITAVLWLTHRQQRRIIQAASTFLDDPNEKTAQQVCAVTDRAWHPLLHIASSKLFEAARSKSEKEAELNHYREFIEAWTHEIKTPLSLATLLLANHKEEMSPYVRTRMEHVRCEIASDVDRVLFYARLASAHVDYSFESIGLLNFIEECLFEFQPLFEEKRIQIQLDIAALTVTSDRKVLAFMLSQLISNACKYAKKEAGEVAITAWEDEEKQRIYLAIRDNGEGASPEDLPFLFDKGFTGNHPNRQNATGMGLYFVKKYADALSIEVQVEEAAKPDNGFGICLVFPVVLKQG